MAEDSKSFTWQTAIALGGLLVSLLGNWIQYQSVESQKVELSQSQAKIDAMRTKEDNRKAEVERRRVALDARMAALDREMEVAKQEEQRGLTGIVLGSLDQKEMGVEIADGARKEQARIKQEKDKLQATIDAANAVVCEGS
jgi:hypothetical protein